MADSQARSSLLRSKSHAFCQAFLASKKASEILDTYFTSTPEITEHGPSLLADVLSFIPNPDAFPPSSDFIVDTSAGGTGMVSVVAHATFASKCTGKGREEDFTYRLSDFDGEGRIGHWEIWADPLNAWEAVWGGLGR
ncbi:hypothetical protein MMC34_002124 [Xylographa carneopallida]|nr:hypothetical protein [Xylographa carneopallida]